jgi:addiction module RelB/DinJ family antitoxin
MNRKATVSATIDPLLKVEVQAILKRFGLSTSQAITLFFQQVQRTQTLPLALGFESSAPNISESLMTSGADVSCLELMQADLGCLKDAPEDLSTNPAYLSDYGL